MEQIGQALVAAVSQDAKVRDPAVKQFPVFENANLALYLGCLAQHLGNDKLPSDARQLAGLNLKNALVSREKDAQKALLKRWMDIKDDLRKEIKKLIVQHLANSIEKVRRTASLVVGKIAAAEIPKESWPELIPGLCTNIGTSTATAELRQCSLEALGYVCEEVPEKLAKYSQQILFAISTGVRKEETSVPVKLAAVTCLFNSLQFTKQHFDDEKDRKSIMLMIHACTQVAESVHIREMAYMCLGEVAGLYYPYLKPYMGDLYTLTSKALQTEKNEVVLQAIEFWNTIADVEIDIAEETKQLKEEGEPAKRSSGDFSAQAAEKLIPILQVLMTKQNEDVDDDTWNAAKAAAKCLEALALAAGDKAVAPAFNFIKDNFVHTNWRNKEAAIMAFGAVLDGPSEKVCAQLIGKCIGPLAEHLKDKTPIVRDSAMWAIGRICHIHPDAIGDKDMGGFLAAVCNILGDKSAPVVIKACWAIRSLADNCPPTKMGTSRLSKFYDPLIKALLTAAARTDVPDESNMIGYVYDALNAVIHNSPADAHGVVAGYLPKLIESLKTTLLNQGLTADDRAKQNEIQAHLCGSLHVICQKLPDAVVLANAEVLLQMFVAVLKIKNDSSVHEESLLAISAIAQRMGTKFEGYMKHIVPFLLAGLDQVKAKDLLSTTVAVVGDVARSVEGNFKSCAYDIMKKLVADLNHSEVHRDVKPNIIACIGDIALAIAGSFEPYAEFVMPILFQASRVNLQGDDNMEYNNTLRHAVLESYIGIINGLAPEGKIACLGKHIEGIFQFLDFLSKDKDRFENVTRSACSLIGDMAAHLKTNVGKFLASDSVKAIVKDGLEYDEEEETGQAAKWAQDNLKALFK